MDNPSKGQLVDVETLARLFNLTERRVQQLAQEGVIPKAEKNQYLLLPAIQGYIRYLQGSQSNRSSDTANSLMTEEIAIKRAKREHLEIKNALLREDLINASDVAFTWESTCSFIKTRILSVPNKLAPHFKKKYSQKELVTLITDALKEELNSLAGTEIRLVEDK
jgi:phage terminase Nu1 subunit (DNA packaging protein)